MSIPPPNVATVTAPYPSHPAGVTPSRTQRRAERARRKKAKTFTCFCFFRDKSLLFRYILDNNSAGGGFLFLSLIVFSSFSPPSQFPGGAASAAFPGGAFRLAVIAPPRYKAASHWPIRRAAQPAAAAIFVEGIGSKHLISRSGCVWKRLPFPFPLLNVRPASLLPHKITERLPLTTRCHLTVQFGD